MNCDQQLDVGDGQELPRARRDPSKVDAPLVRMYNALRKTQVPAIFSPRFNRLCIRDAVIELSTRDIVPTGTPIS